MDKEWIGHAEWVVVLVTLLGGFYTLDGKIERQGNRTDRIYELYCEQQQKIDQKFYDILKESKK